MAQVTTDEKILKKNLKAMRRTKTIVAAAMVVLGVLILLWPEASISIMSRSIGALLGLGGIVCIVMFFVNKERNLVASGSLALGAVLAVLGWFHFQNPQILSELMPAIIGALIVSGGIINVTEAIQIRKDGTDGFWISLLIAVVTIFLGILILLNPSALGKVIVRVMAVVMIFDGASDIWLLGKIAGFVKAGEKALNAAKEAAALDEKVEANVAAIAEAEEKEAPAEPVDYDAPNPTQVYPWAVEEEAKEAAEAEEEAPEVPAPAEEAPAAEEAAPVEEPAEEKQEDTFDSILDDVIDMDEDEEKADITDEFRDSYEAAARDIESEAPASQTYPWKLQEDDADAPAPMDEEKKEDEEAYGGFSYFGNNN